MLVSNSGSQVLKIFHSKFDNYGYIKLSNFNIDIIFGILGAIVLMVIDGFIF